MDDPTLASGAGAAYDPQVVVEDNVGDPEVAQTDEAKAKVAALRREELTAEHDAAAAKVVKLEAHLDAAQTELDRAIAALDEQEV